MKKTIVSGMRPTGKLHLGHFHGVIENWLKLQQDSKCYFFVADWHALTTEYQNPKNILENTKEMLIDWLAFGLDPAKAVIFIQSHVPAHAELHVLLSMITPIGWLERVPSYKELKLELKDKDLSNYGFLGYPVLQTADVVLYKATHVPVGQDQVAHLELAREIIRRFHFLYETKLLVECQPMLTPASKLLGLDQRKMSKSYDNCIYLSDTAEQIQNKLKGAITDPARVRRTDPGNPDVCTIYSYHQVYSPKEQVQEINQSCRTAQIGCIDCKKKLASCMIEKLSPAWDERQKIVANSRQLNDIIAEGKIKANQEANATLQEVKKVMGLA